MCNWDLDDWPLFCVYTCNVTWERQFKTFQELHYDNLYSNLSKTLMSPSTPEVHLFALQSIPWRFCIICVHSLGQIPNWQDNKLCTTSKPSKELDDCFAKCLLYPFTRLQKRVLYDFLCWYSDWAASWRASFSAPMAPFFCWAPALASPYPAWPCDLACKAGEGYLSSSRRDEVRRLHHTRVVCKTLRGFARRLRVRASTVIG